MEDGEAASSDKADVAGLRAVLERFTEKQIKLVYEYYQPDLNFIVQGNTPEVLHQLQEKGVFQPSEAKKINDLKEKPENTCVQRVYDEGHLAIISLWEVLFHLKVSKYQQPTLTRILDEIQSEVARLRAVLERFTEKQIKLVYKYYQPDLNFIVQGNTFEVLHQLQEKGVFQPSEAKKINDLKEKPENTCVQRVYDEGHLAIISLWEVLLHLKVTKYQQPTLTGILHDIQTEGLEILPEVYMNKNGHKVIGQLKHCQDELKRWVTSWTMRFDELKLPYGSKKPRDVKLEDRYTDLIVVSRYRWAAKKLENEMMATASVHDNLAAMPTAVGLCRHIGVDQLFRKSYDPLGRVPLVVVVCGVPGIGKTTMVQKLLYDWAGGQSYRRFSFVFHFRFRDLNLQMEPCSLFQLLVKKHPFLGPCLADVLLQPHQVLFLFDGLDESKEELNFERRCRDPEEVHPFSAIVASLMSQDLLKGCSVLLTSRPTALEKLDLGRAQRYTEILGFTPEQRQEYFEKFYRHQAEGQRVHRHVRGNSVLYSLCFNPSYCWILCSALEGLFARRANKGSAPPRTITQLFALFVANLLTNHARGTSNKLMIKISKMAFEGVQTRVLVFYERDLARNGLVACQFLSGFLMEFLERELDFSKLAFSFLHLTIQEFLAALYFVLHCDLKHLGRVMKLVDGCPDGRYELFVRFLLGLSKPTNYHRLDQLLGNLTKKPCGPLLDWLKVRTTSAIERGDKRILLQALHCLFEAQQERQVRDTLGDHASLDLSSQRLNPTDCSAVAYVLGCLKTIQRLDVSSSLTLPECLSLLIPQLDKCKEIGMDSNDLGTEGLQRLCKRLKQPGGILQTLQLCDNDLEDSSCTELVDVLRSNQHLTNLDLGNNKLTDSGLGTLCTELQKGRCRLEKLGLRNNKLTSALGPILASGVKGSWTLTHLDLNDNDLGDSGLVYLYSVLEDHKCKIQSLKLESNNLTVECCKGLASSLALNKSLTELELNFNSLTDPGVQRLLGKMASSSCQLQTLRLSNTELTALSSQALSNAIHCIPTLRWLDLSNNQLMDEGAQEVYRALAVPNCQIENLWLQSTSLTWASCEDLGEFLRANTTLKALNLKDNKIGDAGLKLLAAGLKASQCQLQSLRLDSTELTADSVKELIAAFGSRDSLTELTLPYNSIGDDAIETLRTFIESNAKLQEIRLRKNKFTAEGITTLQSLDGFRSGLAVSVGE